MLWPTQDRLWYGIANWPCQIKILDALQTENTTGSWMLYSSIADWNARREIRTSGIIFLLA